MMKLYASRSFFFPVRDGMGEGRGRKDFMVALLFPGRSAHSVSPTKPILPFPSGILNFMIIQTYLHFIMFSFFNHIMHTPKKWKNRGGGRLKTSTQK